MKKAFLILAVILSLTGCCLSQVSTQYVYVDSTCTAILPDYTGIVIVHDNCEVANLTQLPSPGQSIITTTVVEIVAVDVAGNESSVMFDVVLLDTIPPTIQLNPEWTGYSDEEVGDMYKTFETWVQAKGVEFNETFPFEEYPKVDSMKIFVNTISIPRHPGAEWW